MVPVLCMQKHVAGWWNEELFALDLKMKFNESAALIVILITCD
jgi:hypothetical protein